MAEQERHTLPSPLLVPTLCWGAGIILAAYFRLPLLWLAGIGCGAILLALAFRFRLPFLLLLLVAAGLIRLNVSVDRPISPLQKILHERESITQPCHGEVLRVLNPAHNLYLVRLTSVNSSPVRDKALMAYSGRLVPGDGFTALALMENRKPDPVLDNTSFYFSHRSKRTPLLLRTVYKLESTESRGLFNLERWRYRLLQNLESKMGDAAPFAKALLLNDRTEDKDWIQQLIRGGLLHLIAISGLHVLFFYFVFVYFLNIFIPKRWAEGLFIVLMLVYAGLCQWSPPVMRAIVMILLLVFGKWLQRPVSRLQIICLSLLIITAYDPLQLFSIGLQLSYLCVIALLYVVPKLRVQGVKHPLWKYRLQRFGLYFADMLIVSFVVSVVMLPIMLFYFYRGSMNGVIGNLLGVPLIGFLLPLTFVLMLLPAGWQLFHWLKATFDLLHFLFGRWAEWTAELPFYIDTVLLPLPLLLAVYLVIAAIAVRIKTGASQRRLSYTLLVLALPFLLLSFSPPERQFTLTVFNAGMGDCTMVEFPRGQTLMIDTGPGWLDQDYVQRGSWFGSRSTGWQKRHKIGTIDILVLTHLDTDHAGGLEDVFDRMRVRNLFISEHASRTSRWAELERAGFLKEAQVKILADTVSIPFAGAKLTFLHPGRDYRGADSNDNSIVLRLDYKGFSALLTGDISSQAEMHLVNELPQLLDTDFLKVPHHGSRYSSSAPFIRAVSPRMACITAGKYNRFGFPHKETLERYRNYGVEPMLTGNGSVVITLP